MHITAMTIGGIPPFTEPVEFKFDEHVNVFIGPNASGKSTLLTRMVAHFRGIADFTRERDEYSHDYLICSDEWPRYQPYSDRTDIVEADLRVLPCIAVPSIRIGSNRKTATRTPEDFLYDTEHMYGYEPRSRQEEPTVAEMLTGSPYDALPDALYAERVEHATTMLFESEGLLPGERGVANLIKSIMLAIQCAEQICPEVIRMGAMELYEKWDCSVRYEAQSRFADFLTRYYERFDVQIHTADGRTIRKAPTKYFGLIDTTVHRRSDNYDDDAWPLRLLSSGTEGTVWWIRYIALNMVYHYGFEDGWEKQPAILLIDEIENHLHPTWQRRVIPALLHHFPGLQIFATTHSPFVVAGLKAGQVHLLNRDENGVVTASANTENIEGWTADEILRVYMGVDEPTDKDTAEAAVRLRNLRDEGKRSDERAEEERQTEMRQLRQIVDRAELSGPRVAEDARFLADLRSILDRYSQSQNLNQENG